MLSDALVAPCAEDDRTRPRAAAVSEVQRATVGYPGGLAARYRWGGSGSAEEVFALSRERRRPDRPRRAGRRRPRRGCAAPSCASRGRWATWTARFASPVFDEPAGLVWDTEAQLVVKYGFRVYGLASRSGELRWSHLSGTPVVAVLGSPRLDHVILQSEVETLALDAAGEVRWRVAHSDVIAARRAGGRHADADQLRRGRGRLRPGQRARAAMSAGVLERDVDEWWTGRCVLTPHNAIGTVDRDPRRGLRSASTRRGPGTD